LDLAHKSGDAVVMRVPVVNFAERLGVLLRRTQDAERDDFEGGRAELKALDQDNSKVVRTEAHEEVEVAERRTQRATLVASRRNRHVIYRRFELDDTSAQLRRSTIKQRAQLLQLCDIRPTVPQSLGEVSLRRKLLVARIAKAPMRSKRSTKAAKFCRLLRS